MEKAKTVSSYQRWVKGQLAAVIGVLAALLMLACSSPAAEANNAQATAIPTLPPAVGLAALPNPMVPSRITRNVAETVEINLEAIETKAKLDDGVEYEFWTFGGTVPGPLLRIRQGDTVHLTLSNAGDSKVAHNIDLHAVTGPGGGAALTNVMPGESKSIQFKALNPGLYVYHCAVGPAALHISNGMYGMILVEPEEGLVPADREYYVMQGDMYLKGARGQKGQHTFSMDKLIDEDADYIVFNGSVGSLTGDRALTARVGDLVRIYFGVGGPNIVSSFHVIGEIFDRVYPEAASEPLTNVQTTLVPAGGATIVEFTTDVPGSYTLVDHSLGRLFKGAAGVLVVEGPDVPDIYSAIP